ncbi:hypothetical protein KCV87_06040 [Actinosynnema pretiosum subsp. pretiosum]|uniref:Asp23/Gls24 family envelope stress response protein n=1 Tax=Actinosynnema pretiosum subsp. pretiosum TaxID=103721 RepID=A0AA45R572_9PSEU|nr:hypothetical protein APASM_2822 [Actinosynnema pretiosum subsp. pretiosum]QUF05657.1 hypothetical protein KCV87_06040 [Actinosynnema pretiosum subsp. pretiosum]
MTPDVEATAVAVAVSSLPQVAGPHAGRYGEIATLLPGRRVVGVRVRPDELVVGVVVRYPATTAEVDAAVRSAVHAVLGPDRVPLHVWIGDVAPPLALAPDRAAGRAARRGEPGGAEAGGAEAGVVEVNVVEVGLVEVGVVAVSVAAVEPGARQGAAPATGPVAAPVAPPVTRPTAVPTTPPATPPTTPPATAVTTAVRNPP